MSNFNFKLQSMTKFYPKIVLESNTENDIDHGNRGAAILLSTLNNAYIYPAKFIWYPSFREYSSLVCCEQKSFMFGGKGLNALNDLNILFCDQ